ncbi:hypothetical protein XELAEV_18004939mg [Xenopus laevis]|uniref:G-protein coupled receptors family 3 profile domain-containing protein n=1 Tax=Xenopus laevis TaxID=8355 RepID=A0A974DVZ9_XENLA|nr:hypothetical protein XELAEV_18004939mg [Xenopus laevis]
MLAATAFTHVKFELLIYLIVLCVEPSTSAPQITNPACRLNVIKMYEEYEYIQEGDIMLGVVIGVNSYMVNYMHLNEAYKRRLCVEHLVDLGVAIKILNYHPSLIPNRTLGYHVYDSCGDAAKAVRSVFQILSGIREPVPNYSCRGNRSIAGFIGDVTSETTVPVAQILSLFGYSQISSGATDISLSDRVTFPYFFRTLQSDHGNYFVLSKLLKHFGWTWIGILRVDDYGGEKEHQLLTNYLSSDGICVEFTIKLRSVLETDEQIMRYKEIIKKSSSRVFVLCGTIITGAIETLRSFINEFDSRTVVVSYSISANYHIMDYALEIFNGSLGMTQRIPSFIDIPIMKDYLEKFRPSKFPEDKLLEDIWMQYHSCMSKDKNKNNLYEQVYGLPLYNCTGKESIMKVRHFDYTLYSPHVGFAAEIMAYAIYDMQMSIDNKIPGKIRNTANYRNQLHHYLKNLQYKSFSKTMSFDNNGELLDKYLFYYLTIKSYKEFAISHVGWFMPQEALDQKFNINTSNLRWRTDDNSENCFKCPDMEWPNENRNQCVAKIVEFLSYRNDVISVFFSSISILFFMITLVILGIFITHWDTPIVRANNRILSFLLLVSIKLSFLSVFLFLGRPVDITCMLRIITFGITFSIAVSSLLAKTIMVYIAFKATKPGSSWRKWVGVKLSNSVVLFCSSIQIIICMTWLAISPPFQELDLHTYPGTIIIQCNEGSAIGFYSVIGYMGLLAAVSFVLAFLARTLPDSFNEAKYITFSMLLFCSVWITMIPAYLSTKGKNTVCVEIFAIVTSSAGLLGCIFLPKCYIIVFKPEINTKSHLLETKPHNYANAKSA